MVSEIGFGAWAIGGRGWGPSDDATSLAAIRCALEVGINFFDTADQYGWGHSEELLGTALLGRRERAVIATKGGKDFYRGPGEEPNFDPGYIAFCVEQSLRRLQTDYIDLYQLHDATAEALADDDLWAALQRLKQQGKIRFYGVSVGPTAHGVAAVQMGQVDTVQVTYNLLEQEAAAQLFPLAQERDVGVIARTPLAAGFLSGKYGADAQFPEGDLRRLLPREAVAATVRKVETLRFLERQGRGSLAQMALAWVLSQPAVAVTIPGARTPQQVQENAAASDLAPLPEVDLAQVASLYSSDFRRGMLWR